MSLESLLSDATSTLNVAVELSSIKISDGTSLTWKYAVLPIDDVGATIAPYVTGLGPFNFAVAEDVLFSGPGLGSAELGSLTLKDASETEAFDSFLDYTFAGQSVVVKIGRTTDLYSAYETYRTAIIKEEPNLAGFSAVMGLESPLGRLLQEPLMVTRNIGIPTCLRLLTSTGQVSATRVAAHDVSRFTISVKFRMSAPPAAVRRLWTKFTSTTTDAHWFLRIETTGKALVVATSGGAADVNHTSLSDLCDGEFHTVTFSRNSATTAYVMIDSVVETTVTPTGSPNLSAANLVWGVSSGGDDLDLVDARFYDRYIPPDEARGLMAVRSDGDDLNCIGLWRFDDNTGGTVNDYSSTAADGTISGVLNTDYSWQPTDLGEPEQAGTIQPIVLGLPLNAKADLIDQARERFRISDEDVVTGGESQLIRSRGTALTITTDYTDQGDGVYQMVAAEDEPVTFDVVSASPTTFANQWPALLTGVLSARAGISPNATQELVLPNLLPWNAGLFFNREATAAEIAAEISSGGLVYYEDSAAALFVDFLVPPLSPGPYGEPCIDLRGDFAYWSFGDIADLTSSSGTFGGWWKTFATDQGPNNYGVTASEQVIVDKILAGSAGYRLDYIMTGTNAGKIRATIKGSGSPATTELLSPAGLVEPGYWYFTVAVFDDTANTLVIFHAKLGTSLAQVASATGVTSTIGNSSEALIVGAQVWGSVGFVQVWNVAKSLAQTQAFMTTPPVGNEANLLAFAPMNEGTGETVSEKVASGTGTITSSYPRWRWAPRIAINLAETPSVKIRDYHRLQPVGRMSVRYARNWTPMTDADIDSGVAQSTRIDLKREWREVPWENSTIQGRYGRARTLVVDTPLSSRVDAQRLVRLLAARYSENRYTCALDLPPWTDDERLPVSRKSLCLGFGDEIKITSTLYGLDSGKAFRTVSMRPDLLRQGNSLALWG